MSATILVLIVQRAGASVKELEDRREYLRQQRDRLLKLKEAKRMKKLDEFTETSEAKGRPKTAKTARAVVDGSEQPASASDKKLNIRFALAARLRREVIDAKK